MIYISIFLFFYWFIRTEQLTCLSNCSNAYVKQDEPIRLNTCIKITSKICKAQIVAYYNGKTLPKYLNYTFGYLGDSQEEKHQQFVKNYGLISFTEYQLLLHAKNDATILIADIYCTNMDDCSLIGIEQLLKKYNHQINPIYHFKSSIYSDSSPGKLLCYDSKSESNVECLTSNNPVCVWNSNGSIKGCSSELDVHLHYTFTISSPDTVASQRTTEFIICNKDNCNDEEILMKLENMAKHHTCSMLPLQNTANRQPFFFGFFFIIICCFI